MNPIRASLAITGINQRGHVSYFGTCLGYPNGRDFNDSSALGWVKT
jgi:hypothetical protein